LVIFLIHYKSKITFIFIIFIKENEVIDDWPKFNDIQEKVMNKKAKNIEILSANMEDSFTILKKRDSIDNGLKLLLKRIPIPVLNMYKYYKYDQLRKYFDDVQNQLNIEYLQNFKLKIFNENDKTDDRIKQLLSNQLSGFMPIETTGDGNCLFNAASIILKNDETLSKELKFASVKIIFENEKYFREQFNTRGANNAKSFEEAVENVAIMNRYQNSFGITALSIAIDRPIWIYEQQNSIEYKTNHISKDRSPILIFLSGNHFSALKSQSANPIFPKEPKFKIFPKQSSIFKKFINK
jgi:hypothetical protein